MHESSGLNATVRYTFFPGACREGYFVNELCEDCAGLVVP